MATGEKIKSFALVLLPVVGLILAGTGPRPAASQEKGARGLFLDPSSGAVIPSGVSSEEKPKSNKGKPAGKSRAAESQKSQNQKGSNPRVAQ